MKILTTIIIIIIIIEIITNLKAIWAMGGIPIIISTTTK